MTISAASPPYIHGGHALNDQPPPIAKATVKAPNLTETTPSAAPTGVLFVHAARDQQRPVATWRVVRVLVVSNTCCCSDTCIALARGDTNLPPMDHNICPHLQNLQASNYWPDHGDCVVRAARCIMYRGTMALFQKRGSANLKATRRDGARHTTPCHTPGPAVSNWVGHRHGDHILGA